MPTDGDLTLGAALRAAREEAGLTVERVAADTRIRATLIRDLESDRFASSGGAVYARGHIKSIAATLRTDPAPLLALFDEAEGQPVEIAMAGPADTVAPTSLGGTEFARGAAASLRPDRRGPRWGVALGAAATVLLGLILVGSLTGKDPDTAEIALPQESSSPSAPAPTSAATLPPEVTASKPPVTGAQLRVRVIGGASWVSISNSLGATLFEGTLGDGQFKDFSDKSRLKVVLGNAYVVNLNCGGKDSGPAGSRGSVKRYACTTTGLTAL